MRITGMRPTAILAVSLLSSLTLAPQCATRPPTAAAPSSEMEAPASAQTAPVVPVVSDDPFVATVRPILATRCAPCHNPGGKMYEKLPFDDGKVVASHSEGILRRLKGEDRAALERWLAGLAPPGAAR